MGAPKCLGGKMHFYWPQNSVLTSSPGSCRVASCVSSCTVLKQVVFLLDIAAWYSFISQMQNPEIKKIIINNYNFLFVKWTVLWTFQNMLKNTKQRKKVILNQRKKMIAYVLLCLFPSFAFLSMYSVYFSFCKFVIMVPFTFQLSFLPLLATILI